MKEFTVEITHTTGMMQIKVHAWHEQEAEKKARKTFEAYAKKRCMSGYEIISVDAVIG